MTWISAVLWYVSTGSVCSQLPTSSGFRRANHASFVPFSEEKLLCSWTSTCLAYEWEPWYFATCTVCMHICINNIWVCVPNGKDVLQHSASNGAHGNANYFAICGTVNRAMIKYSSCWCGMSGHITIYNQTCLENRRWSKHATLYYLLTVSFTSLLQLVKVPPSLHHLILHILPLSVSTCTLAPLSLLKHLLHH